MSNGNMYLERSTCCIESTGVSLDPTAVCNTVAAGCVSNVEYENIGCMLAKIYFPNQTYKAGFTPEVALCNGTMYPELVRIYK